VLHATDSHSKAALAHPKMAAFRVDLGSVPAISDLNIGVVNKLLYQQVRTSPQYDHLLLKSLSEVCRFPCPSRRIGMGGTGGPYESRRRPDGVLPDTKPRSVGLMTDVDKPPDKVVAERTSTSGPPCV
jgi:hypothetical protein